MLRLCMDFKNKAMRCEKLSVNRASKTSSRFVGKLLPKKPRSYFVKPHRKRRRTNYVELLQRFRVYRSQELAQKEENQSHGLSFTHLQILNYLYLSV